MKSTIKFILLAIFLAVLSRVFFYSIVGLVATYSDELNWLSKTLSSVLKEYRIIVFHLNDILNTAISLVCAMCLPMILLGFITGRSASFYSVIVVLASIIFDILFYQITYKDVTLLIDTMLPVWTGIFKLLLLILVSWGMQRVGISLKRTKK